MNARSGNRLICGIILVLFSASLVVQGCASRGGKTYNDGEVRTAQRVQYGTVAAVDEVMVEEDPSLLGPILGGVAGGVLGSLIGSGAGRTLATVGGAAVGALAGGAAEYGVRKYKADQLIIDLDDGTTIVVVQGYDDYFIVGDKVRVLYTDVDKVRVQHR